MYPQLIPLIFFSIAAAFTPGPNNIIGSYSGFNFGIKKSLPLILGVTFGYTTLITLSAGGLGVIFNTYPLLKSIIKVIGSLFLIYLAYKISFQNQIQKKIIKNPVKLIDEYGFDGDFIESQAFAYLAIRSYLKKFITFPSTTGVIKPSLGGFTFKN